MQLPRGSVIKLSATICWSKEKEKEFSSERESIDQNLTLYKFSNNPMDVISDG